MIHITHCLAVETDDCVDKMMNVLEANVETVLCICSTVTAVVLVLLW